jgi:hypothetical protein
MAQDTSASGKPPGRVRKLGEALTWLAALAGSVVTIIGSLPVLSQTTTQIIDAVFYPKPTNLAVFFSDDQPFANQYLQILADRGFETRLASLSDLPKVMESTRPGVIFVEKPGVNPAEVINLDPATQERLVKDTKVVGIGPYGSYFIHALDIASMLGAAAEGNDLNVMLDDPNKPKDIGQGLPTDQPLKLSTQDSNERFSVAAAYDSGSTATQSPQAQGVARMSDGGPRDRCKGDYWAIAIQGNFALWGYRLPAARLSDPGRQLFGDLAVHMRDTPYVSSRRQSLETQPGTLRGRVGCSLPRQTYRFRPSGPGLITAKATASQRIALILNAPFRINYLARQDAPTPQITFQVQQQNLQRPGDWSIAVAYFGDIQPNTEIPYSLQLDYPYSKEHLAIWLAAAAVALALGALASVRLVSIVRRRSHRQQTPVDAAKPTS